MKVTAFDFELPRQLIAERPVEPRDAARLLLVGDGLSDHVFRELPALLQPGDAVVLNDTRVIPARLSGRRGAAAVEATLHKRVADDRWLAFARPARRLRHGDVIAFAGDLSATVAARGEAGEVELAFDRGGAALLQALERHGRMPLPPYIPRPDGPDARDRTDYQTIFARRDGAVAAPTAGLHFTDATMAALRARGCRLVTVTLHVGAGTFLPVKAEDTDDHVMHAEFGSLDAPAAEALNAVRGAGGRIVAIGTTAARLLETATDDAGRIRPFAGDTRLFITPGYRFKAVDRLLTNFHLPRSTLFMLVAAFAGLDRMKSAYEHAKATGYRFYSYGDCCLLQPERPR